MRDPVLGIVLALTATCDAGWWTKAPTAAPSQLPTPAPTQPRLVTVYVGINGADTDACVRSAVRVVDCRFESRIRRDE